MSRLWVFDFDGTLVNSEPAKKKCYLKVTSKLIPSRVNFVKSILIGPTLNETASLILSNKNEELLDQFTRMFIEEYDQRILLQTKPYKYAQDYNL